MRIRFLTAAANSETSDKGGTWSARFGDVLDIQDALARRYIASGQAEPAEEEIRTATVTAPRAAVAAAGRVLRGQRT